MKPASFMFDGEIPIRVLARDGAFFFVAVDVCRAIEIVNARHAVRSLDDDEKDVAICDTLGGPQEVLVVSESGLYALIFKSRKSQAIRFQKWVTAEVLPSIRTTGRYDSLPVVKPQALPESLWVRLVTEARHTFGVRIAAELWLSSGLPTVKEMRNLPLQSDMFVPWAAGASGSGLITQ